MNRKVIIFVILAILSINCEESNKKETGNPTAEFLFNQTQEMLVKNLKNALDTYVKYNEAYNEFKQTTPDHLRHLQWVGECKNDNNCMLVPFDAGCTCNRPSDCCSKICQSNYCVPN